ncbi:lipocalin-like domain-containing protein [Adhaeribacter rhizoryzae]|uniref:Lipocalin family protein n=1 Tax=Adhaeribacter rhizoryzae TaxID=2607907 RepID=A0A5M6DFY5_9BACT|nr:lipocalin family protein [Adhaeribacter rhizoryzae]KAA5546428.1 lipocalin family protein [Adhaeribacter rhizoryzae]
MKHFYALRRNYSSLLTLLLLVVALFNGCSEIENKPSTPPDPNFTAESTHIQTFEVVTLKAKKPVGTHTKGTLGNISVDLIKTSDSTLTFIVPDIANGEHLLKFDAAALNFTVTQTLPVDADKLFNNLFGNFNSRVAALTTTSEAQQEEVKQMNQFRENLAKGLNALSAEQKQQTMLFFEANKEAFNSFSTYVTINLNAATTLRLMNVNKQTDCPQTDYKSFYECTSANLANSYAQFKGSTKKMLEMLSMASVMGGVALKLSALGPVALGITAVGMSLPLTMALYLGVTEVWPAWLKLRDDTKAFLKAPWIFRQELFEKMNISFQTDKDEDLNLDAGFRTLSAADNQNTETNYIPRSSISFLNIFARVNTYWDKLNALFGELPTFQPGERLISLATENIQITAISNSQVQLVSKAGESARFKSLSGKDESFDFKIKVTKEGFTQEKVVNAQVTGLKVYAETIESYIGHLQPFAITDRRAFVPLQVKVKDAAGKLLAGVQVEWRIKSGGGKLYSVQTASVQNTATSLSRSGWVDDDGIASIEFYPGNDGIQEVEAITRKKDGSLVSGSPVSFKMGAPILGKWNLVSYKTQFESAGWKAREIGSGNYINLTTDTYTNGQMIYSDFFDGNTSKGGFTISGHRSAPTTYFLGFDNKSSKPACINGTYTIKSLTATEMILEGSFKVERNGSYYNQYEEVIFKR